MQPNVKLRTTRQLRPLRWSQTNVDVVCPVVASWEENKESLQRIPGPVLPLFTHGNQTHPSLEEFQDAAAAAAWYFSLTTMAALQASWDFLNDFHERRASAIVDFLAGAAQSKWGVASNGNVLGAPRIREMEDKYLPCVRPFIQSLFDGWGIRA